MYVVLLLVAAIAAIAGNTTTFFRTRRAIAHGELFGRFCQLPRLCDRWCSSVNQEVDVKLWRCSSCGAERLTEDEKAVARCTGMDGPSPKGPGNTVGHWPVVMDVEGVLSSEEGIKLGKAWVEKERCVD